MGNFIDLTGQRFGKLTVIERAENRIVGKKKPKSKPYWLCQCDCGNLKEICGDNLRSGASNSCGCEVTKSTIRRSTKHGFSRRGKNRSRIYKIWAKMKARCNKEKDKAYPDYGGRGISVCKEWDKSFESFKNWAFANGYTDDLTIDRIDVNGNYEPSNCRWVGWDIQANNTRRTKRVTLGDVTHSLKEWCGELRLNYSTVQSRLNHGATIYEAMFTPAIKAKRITASDEDGNVINFSSVKEAANYFGVTDTPIINALKNDRLYKGYKLNYENNIVNWRRGA